MKHKDELKVALAPGLAALDLLLKSVIPREKARDIIRHHRDGLGEKQLKSVWLDKTLITYIADHAALKQIDGLRVYIARYDEDGTTPSGEPYKKDDATVVVVPTYAGVTGGHTDIEDAYFNYGSPCPPSKGCKDEPDDFQP